MRAPLAAVLASILALPSGCGGASSSAGTTAEDPPLPSTALDPVPFTPRPTTESVDLPTDGPVALSATGSHERARRVAIDVVLALRDGDEAALDRLLSERLAQVQPRLTPPSRPREEFVQRALHNPRRAGLDASIPLEELIDLASLEVHALSELGHLDELPEGIGESDLLVVMRLLPRGRAYFRFLVPGWNLRGTVLVRPDRDARAIGI